MAIQKKIIHFETLGCRLNQDESEGAAKGFSDAGFLCGMEGVTSSAEKNEDVILSIINTCTVTAKAEQKARRIIRLLLEKFPNAPLIVTGCYAQLDGALIKQICPDRIVILPGSSKASLLQAARHFAGTLLFSAKELSSFFENLSKPMQGAAFSLYTPVFEKHSRASLKIQDGCNNACTFCRIHLARGKSVSLDVQEVLNRVQELEEKNVSEVVFTGVNLSQYSAKNKDGLDYDFADLLNIVLGGTSKIKIRISSFYPQHITERLCEYLSSGRIQPSFHLSVQSGSDAILKKMARPYKAFDVERAVTLLRETKDNPFIGCDMIAGFPGEQEEDFALTKELCRKLKFAWIHAFPFSPRPGTPAFSMQNQVPSAVKSERAKCLFDFAVNGKISYIKSCGGKVFEAVCENSRSDRLHAANGTVFHAVTSNFLHVKFESKERILPGTCVKVKILEPLQEDIKRGMECECSAELYG